MTVETDAVAGHPANAAIFTGVETIDFADPNSYIHGHPYSSYRELREEAPVYWNPQPEPAAGFWVLTRYEDISYVSKNPDLFCNRYGYKAIDEYYDRIGEDIGAAMHRILVHTDPPDHTQFRRVLSPFFSARKLKELEEQVRRRAQEAIERVKDASTVDFVSDLAVLFPIEVLADILGIEGDDRSRIHYWTDAIFGADDPDFYTDPADAAEAFREMFRYGQRAIDARREKPSEDVLSVVANTKIDGEYLDREHADGTLAMLIGAGNETTRNSISASILALSQYPDVRRQLAEEPSQLKHAVDELLRYVTPAIHMRRTVTEDTEIRGQTIAAGEKVVMLYGSANRDPEVFPDPDRLDIERPNAKDHLAFGIGIHRCIGALLARLELQLFLEEFLPRYPDYEIIGEPRYLRNNFVHSIKSMQINLSA